MTHVSVDTFGDTDMDLAMIVYTFVMALGSPQFVINDYAVIGNDVVEVDVQTMGMPEEQRWILLVDNGYITQHVKIPLVTTECANPN